MAASKMIRLAITSSLLLPSSSLFNIISYPELRLFILKISSGGAAISKKIVVE